jgi:hypothetical protein
VNRLLSALQPSPRLRLGRLPPALLLPLFARSQSFFCGGSRAGCKYVSCHAGDTPASTETRVNPQSAIGNQKFPSLPLTGAPGIECRSGPVAGEHKLVFTFSNAVVSGNASVTSGAGNVSGSPTFAGKTMTVNLTGVTNAQQITVKLSGVTDAVAQVLPDTNVSMGVLFADVNSSKRTDSGDVTVVRNQTVLIPDQSTCRFDVNTDGRIDAGDVTATRNATVTVLP